MYTVQFGCFSTVRYLKAPQTNIIKQVIDFWQAACTVTGVNQGPARAGKCSARLPQQQRDLGGFIPPTQGEEIRGQGLNGSWERSGWLPLHPPAAPSAQSSLTGNTGEHPAHPPSTRTFSTCVFRTQTPIARTTQLPHWRPQHFKTHSPERFVGVLPPNLNIYFKEGPGNSSCLEKAFSQELTVVTTDTAV